MIYAASLYRMKYISVIIVLSFVTVCWPTSKVIAGDEPLYDSMMTIYRTRDYDSAIVFANQAIEMLRSEGKKSSKQSARLQHRLASCYQQKGDWAEAIKGYERAIETWRSLSDGDPLGLAASLGNVGQLYGEFGLFTESRHALIEALELKEQNLPDTAFSLARTCQKVGDFYRKAGDYKLAEKYLLKAHKIYLSGSSRRRVNLLQNQNNLAVVYHLQNRYEDAARTYEEVIEGLKLLDYPGKWNKLLGIMGNLATLRGGQREFKEAVALFKYGLSVIDSLNLKAPERRAQYLGYLGETYYQMKRFPEAEENMKKSLEILDSLWKPGNPLILERQNTLADIYRATKRYSEADSLYSLVLISRIDRLGNRHPDVGMTYLNWSRLQERTGAIDSAIQLANSSFSIHQRNFFEGVTVLSEDDALSYAQNMRVAGLQIISLGSQMLPVPDVSLSTLVTIKRAVTDQLISRYKSLRMMENESIGELIKKYREIRANIIEITIGPPSHLDKQQIQSQVDSLTRLAEEFESEISRKGDITAIYESSGIISVDSIVAAIPPNACLIEYLRAENIWSREENEYTTQYMAIVLGYSGVRSLVSLGSASVIDSVVALYRSHFLEVASRNRYPLAEDAKAYDAISNGLYGIIWQPLESAIGDYETIIIAPDGALNLVSFAGLKNSSGKYLIEDKSIVYVGTGRDLLRSAPTRDKSGGLLAFGDPDYDAPPIDRKTAQGKGKLSTNLKGDAMPSFLKGSDNDCFDLADISVKPLPASGSEVRLVAEAWKNSPDLGPIQAFYKSAASEDNFKKFAGEQSVIHLSTHGYYLRADCDKSALDEEESIDPYVKRNNPLIYSGLLLAGSNLHGEGAKDAAVEDGILTAEEISGIDLRDVSTVVLSACETALGDIRNNEGVFGLRRAFLMAGVGTVVSALWKVPSDETATFFGELYKNSSESLPNRIRQLQLAQIAKFRAAGFADHPFGWGAFIAIGHGN